MVAADAAKADDEVRARTQAGRDGDKPKRFSLIDAMRMDIDSGVFKEAGDKIKQGATEGGQALGDEATQKLAAEMAALGQRLGQAAAAEIRAVIGNMNVNVNVPKVNANTGKTNEFARSSAVMGPR